jgi:hypothetical protein
VRGDLARFRVMPSGAGADRAEFTIPPLTSVTRPRMTLPLIRASTMSSRAIRSSLIGRLPT